MKIMQRTTYDQATHFVSSDGTLPQNMFNSTLSELTTKATDMTVVITPGFIGSIGFAGVSADSIRVVGVSGATTIYDQTRDLNQTIIASWFDYYFEPFDFVTEALFDDIPPYSDAEFTITIAGTNVECGVCAFGPLREIGSVAQGAQLGILDYSTKETDPSTGVVTFAEGPFSKRFSVEIFAETGELTRIQNTLTSVISTPTFWSAASDTTFRTSFVVFGFYRDFYIVIPYPNHFLCSLEIEGLV